MDKDTMNIIAVVSGPILAVIITLLYQKRKEKRDAKYQAFLRLMAYRKSIPPNPVMIEILNILDVIFADNKNIVDLWHKYYSLLSQPPSQEREHTWLELLSEIAKDLNYPTLKQTDLDKFYIPQGHFDQFVMNAAVQREFLRVLQNTASFVVTKKEEVVKQTPDIQTKENHKSHEDNKRPS